MSEYPKRDMKNESNKLDVHNLPHRKHQSCCLPHLVLLLGNSKVKGEYYFDCDDKNGFFAKKKNVKKRPCEEEEIVCEEKKLEEVSEEELQPPVNTEQETTWKLLLLKDDLTLEKAALLLLLSLSSSKAHQDLMIQSEILFNSMMGVLQIMQTGFLKHEDAARHRSLEHLETSTIRELLLA